nr:diphosphomevalonate decarboxylase [uncultured Cardiobacterium sp.]
MTPADYLAPYLPSRLEPVEVATAYAPANIALAKYWGKRDRVLNLPVNGSLSISLGSHGSRTTIRAADADSITLNGERAAGDSPLHRRTFAFIEHIRRGAPQPLAISSENTIPTAAGLASSASGFAALTRALNAYWQLGLPDAVLSALARIGSGSAARSLWHGFVKWDKGEQADGSDSIAAPIVSDWQDLRIALLPIDSGAKKTTSGDGMNHTTATSPLYAAWPATAARDLATIEAAIHAHDFTTLAATAEANALAMHATMLAARPALCYLHGASLDALHRLWQQRADGLEIYATIDAGPNIKILYQQRDEAAVRTAYPQAVCINPFVVAG